MSNRQKRYGRVLAKEETRVFGSDGRRLTPQQMRASKYGNENILTQVVRHTISHYLSDLYESGIDYNPAIANHCYRIMRWLTEPQVSIGEFCAQRNYSGLVNLTAQGESSEVAKNILGYLEMRFPDEIKSLSGKHE